MSKPLKRSLESIFTAALALASPLGIIDTQAAENRPLLTGQQEMDASMDALQKVISLSQVKQPTPNDRKRLRNAAEEGLKHGQNFLDKVKLKSQAPGFDDAFRGHYLTGLRKIRDGVNSNDSAEISAGARMLNQFIDWMQRQRRG